MKVMRIIYITLLLGFIFSQNLEFHGRYLSGEGILEKGKSITVDPDDYIIFFDTKDFKEGEEMYFKIKAKRFYHYYVNYEFVEINPDVEYQLKPDSALHKVSFDLKSDYENIQGTQYTVKYFTIKKDKSKFNGSKGDWLVIYFYVDGDSDNDYNEPGDGKVIIENTLEDEGKFETWKIVVIVVVIVLVIAVMIGCYCYRRKKQLAAANQNAGYPAQTVGVNQYNNAQYDPQYNQAGSNYNVNQQYNQPVGNYDPNQQYNQPVGNYDPNQPYNQPVANYDPNQPYNQPVANY